VRPVRGSHGRCLTLDGSQQDASLVTERAHGTGARGAAAAEASGLGRRSRARGSHGRCLIPDVAVRAMAFQTQHGRRVGR
jgi:hypothetical protein